MAVYLIRHGETAGNAQRVIQHPHTPLSDDGEAQARRLAARLASAGIERILVSDYARAHQTAEALAAATGVSPEVDPLLRERNLGDLRGRPYAELASEGIEPFAPGYTPPAGESWEVFHERVDRAWALVERVAGALAAAQDRHLAVVTHGLVKSSVVSRLVTIEGGGDAPFGWVNTSVTIVEGPAPWRATLVNCATHLDTAKETGPA